jgi:cytochrome c
MSFGVANGADNLQKQALDLANQEIDKYVAHCGDSWYASDYYFQPFVEMKHRNVPSMSVYGLSEADRLNSVEWSGTFVYTFQPNRRGYVKNGALNWQQWSNSEEHFTVKALRSNGQWQVSVATSPGGDSWVQHNKWLSSCADLSGNKSTNANSTSSSDTKSFIAIGRFSCDGSDNLCAYDILLWRDSVVGIVGYVGFPVMESDTPTSFIEQMKYNPSNGSLSFQAVFENKALDGTEVVNPDHTIHKFVGTLIGDTLKGTFTEYSDKKDAPRGGWKKPVMVFKKNGMIAEYRDMTDWLDHTEAPVTTAQSSKDQMLILANAHKCFSCHNIDKKVVGPAWRDVAARYRGMDWAEDTLIAKVRQGGAGAWGSIPMIPHSEMTQTDIKALVKFILSL